MCFHTTNAITKVDIGELLAKAISRPSLVDRNKDKEDERHQK